MPLKGKETGYDKPYQQPGAEALLGKVISVAAYISGALALAGVVACEAIRDHINPAPPTQ